MYDEQAAVVSFAVQGKIEEVSRGITCHDVREPLGVVASIVPFNFPVMVPLWTIPIALTAGNWCGLVHSSALRAMCFQAVFLIVLEVAGSNSHSPRGYD